LQHLNDVSGSSGSFDRLSALDAVFLSIEDERNQMHVGVTALFEAGPLRTASGAVDRERVRRFALRTLSSLPKFRRKLARLPIMVRPVLVDDDRFDLDQQLRFVTLDRGDDAGLLSLVGRIYSEPLDRGRPLWELWVVDGLAGDRVAVVSKSHHCLVDGVSGIAAFTSMLRATPEATFEEAGPLHFEPPPSTRSLLAAELRHLADAARDGLGLGATRLGEAARTLGAGLSYGARAVFPPGARTSLNPSRIGTSRDVVWVEMSLAEVKAVKNAASVKVNDVALGVVAGALRRYFARHGEPVGDRPFRAMVPVSTHDPGRAVLENEVSLVVVPLPLDEPDANRRLALVAQAMEGAKSSGEVKAIATLESLADALSFAFAAVTVRALVRFRPYNVIVTNVPGPPVPLYFLGARLVSAYPMVPLYGNNALGIAILSYDDRLCWGLSADPERIQDLPALAEDLRGAFDELKASVLH
jgi:WS/DGAT/MGAT family acyltransferase